MKYFIFRFDIETHKCLGQGVPNLLNVAKRFDAKFTFFISFGRSIHHLSYIKEKLRKPVVNETIKSLTALNKLGYKEYLYLSLFNPIIGRKYNKILQRIIKEGHDLGIHGGKNHETWQKYASSWSKNKIRNEVNWALKEALKLTRLKQISGFSSPGWNSPTYLPEILHDLKFTFYADLHFDGKITKINRNFGLLNIPTNIVGEPGGVGYIEFCRAKKLTDEELLKDFEQKLKQTHHTAVMYDHPYLVGIRELHILEKMLYIIRKKNFRIITMQEYCNAL